MRNQSVSAKILAATIGAALSLALGLMLVMFFFMNSLTDSIMLNMLQPMARTAAQNVENRLQTLAEQFFTLRENEVLRTTDVSPMQKQQSLDIINSGREYAWLGLYETDGAFLIGNEDCPRTIRGRELYPQLRSTANMVIEKTSINPQGPEIVMGIPIWDETDETVLCYLVGSHKYDALSDVLRDINIGTSGTAFIIDQDGTFIAHKDLGKVYSQQSIKHSLGDNPEVGAILEAMLQNQTGSVRLHSGGQDFFLGYSPIKGTLWSLAIQAPRNEFMAPAQHALFMGAVIIAVVLLITVLLVGFFNRRVLSLPLRTITDNAAELSMGNFDHALESSLTARRDEIGRLGTAFERMSAAVRGVVHDIGSLTSATRSGALDFRVKAETYHGDFRRIVRSMNAALDGICSYLDNMPGSILLLNEQREPMYHNRAMAEIMQRHRLQADARGLLALLPGGSASIFPPEAAELFTTAKGCATVYESEISLPCAVGEGFDYAVSLGRVEDSFQAGCVMLILHDVTQLTRAKKQAEAASNAKSDFLSRMTHEIRTPMNAVIGMASIGMNAEAAERKHYCLDKIAGASKHLLGVINDILDMSKIEADKFELSIEEFNPVEMLENVADVVRFQAEEKKQNFTVYIDEAFPACLASDGQRMAQVITNLLSNAVKFTPEGGEIALAAKVEKQDEKSCSICVAVSDTGIGLSIDQLKKLFRPFEQADGSISRKFGGTGLGLAISKRIAESMNGNIEVKSEPGKGATFSFKATLPKGLGGDLETPPEPETNVGKPGAFKGKRVLIAEDVEINREIVHALLENTGIEMVFAHDGKETVETFKAAPDDFDLILMDIQMPNMDGHEATRRIRACNVKKGRTIPIVAMTANVFRNDVERCLAVGMNDHLGKPVDVSEILATLSKYLR